MKLSKLKKIIKQTLLEQNQAQPANARAAGIGRQVTLEPCPGNPTGTNVITWASMSVNGNVPVVGDKIDLTNVPYISNVGYWKIIKVITSPNLCGHPSNVNGVCDLPTHNDPCDDRDPGTGLNCTEKDFQYNATPCGQTHLVPAPGGAGSWQNWLNAQWNAYSTGVTQTGQPVECYQFGAIITWITDQLNNPPPSGWNPTQLGRKNAKRDWAVCMVDHCDCKNINTSWGDPCDDFNAATPNLQTGCCEKWQSAMNSGNPLPSTDPCYILTNNGECCKPQREDVRGCLNPAQQGALNIGDPCPGSVGTVTLHHEPCCKYDDRDNPCKTFYAMPQAYQDGCCEKCQGNILPSDPCYQYCKCCDPIISDDPCKDNPNPECYWCFEETSQGGPCQPVGGNLNYAITNGITLYQDPAVCAANEPGCRRDDIDPQMIVCHKCANGYPVSNMFPGPNCPQGWQSMPPFDPAKCKPDGPDPSDPVDMVNPGMQRMRDLMEYKKPK